MSQWTCFQAENGPRKSSNEVLLPRQCSESSLSARTSTLYLFHGRDLGFDKGVNAMYEVDSSDTIVELFDVPKPDIGAPLPLLLCNESHLILAYLVSESDADWDGSYVTMVTPDSEGLAVACIRFTSPSAHMLGPPNDEAFDGHPLAGRGLHPYAVFEVHNSSWIRKLERMNAVHPGHNREQYLEGRRHFVFVFHDSTFECIAHGFEAEILGGSMRSALNHMVNLLSTTSG